jgi:hypothetical protein
MPNRTLTTSEHSEVHYIALAADLAAAMLRELDCLQSDNVALALLMGTAGSSAQQQLLSLMAIIEWITLARDAAEGAELIAHAKALLLRLADELELLSDAAGCDFECSAPLWERFGSPGSLFHFEATNVRHEKAATPTNI